MRLALTVAVILGALSRVEASRPVDSSVSSLDDEGDALWLDKAEHFASMEAMKDIHEAEAANRGQLAHIVQTEEAAYKLDTQDAYNKVQVAKMHLAEAGTKAAAANQQAAAAGVKQDTVENELLEDDEMRAADESYHGNGGYERSGADEDRIQELKKTVQDVRGHARLTDKLAHDSTYQEHQARKELRDAREERDISESLYEGSRLDHLQARRAEEDAKRDAEDAALRSPSKQPSQLLEFGDDPTAGYVVEGQDIYQARIPEDAAKPAREEQLVSPVREADKAANAVQEALAAEKAMESRDVSWALKVGAAHGFGPAKAERPQLGEAGAPVFRIRAGGALAAISEVSNIARKMKASANAAMVVAGNQADHEVLESARVLAQIGKAANATIVAAKAADAATKMEKDANDAVATVSGLGQANDADPPSDAVQAMIARLQQKVKEQQFEIQRLSKQSGPFAAEQEASRWMSAQLKKQKKDDSSFDETMNKAELSTKKREEAAASAQKWIDSQEYVDNSQADLDEMKKAADDAVSKYVKASVLTGQYLTEMAKLSKRVQEARSEFESFGPKMSQERIDASAAATMSDHKRTQAEAAMHEAEANWRGMTETLQNSVRHERETSLEMLNAMKQKIASMEDFSSKSLSSQQLKCAAEKATAVSCSDVKTLLKFAAKKNSCKEYPLWRQGLEQTTCVVDHEKTKAKLGSEHEALEKCRRGFPALNSNSTTDVILLDLQLSGSCTDHPDWTKDCVTLSSLGQCGSPNLRSHCRKSCKACDETFPANTTRDL